MRTLGLIPARSGSKGVPGKNMRRFWGRPLAGWAVKVGLETCDQVVVSTDDRDVALLATGAGVKVINRPAELAQDDTPMMPVIQHALESLWDSFDVLVLLQPTQPLRTAKHIRDGLSWLEAAWDSVVSVIPVPERYLPGLTVRLNGERLVQTYEHRRRQEADEAYIRDGTFYIARTELIRGGTLYGNCRAYVMDPDESENIDSLEDWYRAEAKMARLVA